MAVAGAIIGTVAMAGWVAASPHQWYLAPLAGSIAATVFAGIVVYRKGKDR